MVHLNKALPDKSEVREFIYRRWPLNIYLKWPSGRTVTLPSAQPLTEMTARFVSWE